jgi:hypothetical protein
MKRKSAEALEVEIDGDDVAFWWGDLNGGGVGLKGFSGEFKLESRTG